MEKIEQRVENFFAEGTLGASEGKSLENIINRMNKEGWNIDQIVPLSFRPSGYSSGGMDVASGVVLCSKYEKFTSPAYPDSHSNNTLVG